VIANLEERKGHIYLFKALQYIKETHPEFVMPLCIIEGMGPLQEQLKRDVQGMNIASHVVFIATKSIFQPDECIGLHYSAFDKG